MEASVSETTVQYLTQLNRERGKPRREQHRESERRLQEMKEREKNQTQMKRTRTRQRNTKRKMRNTQIRRAQEVIMIQWKRTKKGKVLIQKTSRTKNRKENRNKKAKQ